jgi:hypothetical protein
MTAAIKKPRREYRDAFGRRLPSVTTIIEGNLGWGLRGLMYWAHTCGERGEALERARRDAMDGGTAAHAFIEAELTDTWPKVPVNFPPEVVAKGKAALAGFVEWRKTVDLKHISSEEGLVVAKDNIRFGGTYDHVVMLNGKRTICDLKTSKSLYPDVSIQIAAYAFLWNHHHPGEPIEQGLILHAPEGNFRAVLVTQEQLGLGLTLFLNLLFAHQNKKHLVIDEEEASV